MYSDAYSLAVPPEKLAEAVQVFTSCRLRRPLEEVLGCARQAAAGTFCPCITAAGGGFASCDQVIFEAVAAEIERRISGQAASTGATPFGATERDRSTAGGDGDGTERGGRVMSEDMIDQALEATFPASDPPAWTLGPPRPAPASIAR